MTELKRIIAVSKSVRVQHEYHGGNRFEGTELWSSESEEVPSDLPKEDVDEVRLELRERVNADLERQKALLIASLNGKPQDAPTPNGTPAGATSLRMAPTASSATISGGSGVAKTPFRRVPANSVPATPPVKVPDGPDGTPFP